MSKLTGFGAQFDRGQASPAEQHGGHGGIDENHLRAKRRFFFKS